MVAGYTLEDRTLAALKKGEHTLKALAAAVLLEHEIELQLDDVLYRLLVKERVERVGTKPRRWRLIKEEG